GMGQISQAGGGRVVGEVEVGRVLDGQDRAARGEIAQRIAAQRIADAVGLNLGVIEEAIGGLGGGPAAGGLGEARLGGPCEVLDDLEEAMVQALVPEVDVVRLNDRSHSIFTNTMADWVESCG